MTEEWDSGPFCGTHWAGLERRVDYMRPPDILDKPWRGRST